MSTEDLDWADRCFELATDMAEDPSLRAISHGLRVYAATMAGRASTEAVQNAYDRLANVTESDAPPVLQQLAWGVRWLLHSLDTAALPD